ncbi:MAG TPA: glycosyltransferase family 2 protein [Aliidongia sp.]|nr:glycosyltransferase family 2 protein [Aliidongia sp.]
MNKAVLLSPYLSLVAPCYNEAEGLPEFFRRAAAACRAAADEDYEIVLVNDGSEDESWAAMRALCAQDPHLTVVNLSRNHGHQLALSAGLKLCRGERILIIDADLQDPPELLGGMMTLMDNADADVVYGQRRRREGETPFKSLTAKWFYRLLRRLIDIDIPLDTGDFRLMSRRCLDVLNAMPEHHRFIRGMVSWIGMRQVPFPYDRDARFAGSTKYSLSKMIRFALDAITGFSVVPLRVASGLGLLLGIVGLLMLSYTFGSWAFGHVVDGWTSITTIILIIGSSQLLVLGVMGEYVGRLYMESKRRPLFVIESVLGGRSAAIEPARPGKPAQTALAARHRT